MKRLVSNNLFYAQLCFFSCLIIAILLAPQVFSDNHGLSFLGEHLKTTVPFGAGILACDYFLLKMGAEWEKSGSKPHKLTPVLRLLALLFLLILLTPDTVDAFFDWSHILVSTILFLYELWLCAWLILYYQRNLIDIGLWCLLFGAGIIAMLSQIHIIDYLSEGILAFQLIFSVLLLRLVMCLESAAPKQKRAF